MPWRETIHLAAHKVEAEDFSFLPGVKHLGQKKGERWGRGWEAAFLEKTTAAIKRSGADSWEGSQPPGAK